MPKQHNNGAAALAGRSSAELRRALAARELRLRRLAQERDRLVARLAEVNKELTAGGAVPGRIRAGNKVKLAPALAAALKGKEMSVAEAIEAVQNAGYVTTSPNFRSIVNMTLLNDRLFRRVGHGVYTAK